MAAKPAKSTTRAARPASAPGLSIVVPVFNEARGLSALHERIADVARWLKAKRNLETEVIYVDDGSTDGTNDIAHGLIADPLDIQVVTLSRNFSWQGGRRCSPASTMPGSMPCCSWTATASIRLDLVGTLVARAGSMTVTTWSIPPRRTAKTNPGCAAPAFIGSTRWSTWARQMDPEDAGDFRLPSPRAAAALRQMPERNWASSRGSATWIGFKSSARRLRAGGARNARRDELECLDADRPVDRRTDVVHGCTAAHRQPARASLSSP